HVVERLLRAVRLHRRRPLPAFSAGVANSPTDGRSRAELLARADEALYADKRAGKSAVVATPRSDPSAGGTRALVVDDDAGLRAPFSPLELLALAERLLGRVDDALPRRDGSDREEQVQLYAQDLRHLLEIERGQRALLQHAYRQTVGALAAALESKDLGTGAH